MSERAIADPTEHGWVDAGGGKWVWGGSGGGSGNGSIQDGDTEGQITTWDGTEWTPEGAVVVDADGNVLVNNQLSGLGMFRKMLAGLLCRLKCSACWDKWLGRRQCYESWLTDNRFKDGHFSGMFISPVSCLLTARK